MSTRTAIESGGAVLTYVCAIEGYEYLLCSTTNTAAVTTAWSGSGYTSAVSGFSPPGNIDQRIELFSGQVDFSSIALRLYPGSTDQLGVDVFSSQRNTGNRAQLATALDVDDTTVTVDDTTDLASSGTAYIGTERLTYSGSTATTLTGVTRGTPVPFPIDGGSAFGRPHNIGKFAGQPTVRPFVTDWKRRFIGCWVGVWCHHQTDGDGTLETKANAEQVFAGTIVEVQDAEDGSLIISCTDARERVANAVLLQDQFSCSPAPGVVLSSNDLVRLTEYTRTSGGTVTNYAEEFTADDMSLGGLTTSEEAIQAIQTAIQGSSLNYAWDVRTYADFSTQFVCAFTGTFDDARMTVTLTGSFAQLLGYDTSEKTARNRKSEYLYGAQPVSVEGTNQVQSVTSQFAQAYAAPQISKGLALQVTGASGTFVDQVDQMPSRLTDNYDTSSGSWGFLKYRDRHVLVKYSSDTVFSEVYWDRDIDGIFEQEPAVYVPGDEVIRRNEEVPRYKQVIALTETFDQAIPKLFASTGVANHNVTTWDEYDQQLGLAIPWSLLGDAFLESVRSLAQLGNPELTIILDRPTKFDEILSSELALRNAFLAMRDGGLVFVRPSASVQTADHTLGVGDTAADPDAAHQERVEVSLSRDYLRNSIKVEFDRAIDGTYRSSLEVRNPVSISDHGRTETITIRARNFVTRGFYGDPQAIYDFAAALAGDMLAIFDEPLLVVRRSINAAKMVGMAAGDTVALTDNFIRDVETGSRGIASALGYVISISKDWQRMRGEVELVLTGDNLARAARYSPAAQVSSYDSGGPSITCVAHAYSDSSEPVDLSRFSSGDKVTIIERSPATIGSPQQWNTVIDGDPTGNDADLTDPLTGFDSNKEYYLISRDYSNAASAQQPDSYLADDGDNKIVNTELSRTFIAQPTGALIQSSFGSTQSRHEYPADDGTWGSEGAPYNPHVLHALADSANSIAHRRTAVQMPFLLASSQQGTTSSSTESTLCFPVYFHLGSSRGISRTLQVGLRIAIAGTVPGSTIRIYSSRDRPLAADAATTLQPVQWFGIRHRYVEFTYANTVSEQNVASTTLPIVRTPNNAATWITVTGKITSGTGTITFHGLHTLHLNPVT